MRKGFDQLGFASDELDAIYSVMAAIIHIGDLDLVPAGQGTDNTDRCKIANLPQANIGIIHETNFQFLPFGGILEIKTNLLQSLNYSELNRRR